MMEDCLIGEGFTGDRAQRQRDAAELSELRSHKPVAFRTAQEIIAIEYPNMPTHQYTPPGANYTPPYTTDEMPVPHFSNYALRASGYAPQNSYEDMIYAGQRSPPDHSLNSAMTTPPASYNQGLRFSPSQNTFTTVRATPSPMLPTRPTVAWTPLGRDYHNPAQDPDAIELVVPSRPRSRAHVSSQTTLRSLHATPSLRTPIIPAQGCARGWRPAVHSAACDADCGHALLDPRLARQDPVLLREQRDISDAILAVCCMCPPLAVGMACGGLGWLARWLSDGRVKKMGRRQIRRARYVAAPLSVLVWVLGALLVVVVVLTRRE